MFDINKRMPARDDELAAVCTNSRLKTPRRKIGQRRSVQAAS
jgi:hypothetical protein